MANGKIYRLSHLTKYGGEVVVHAFKFNVSPDYSIYVDNVKAVSSEEFGIFNLGTMKTEMSSFLYEKIDHKIIVQSRVGGAKKIGYKML